MNNRLALGTVQFGLPYGITNQVGQVSRDEADAILRHARAIGMDTLDTAITYGDSEQRLGESGVGHWRVITKLPAIPASCIDVASWALDSVTGSLQRLGIPRLGGLLLHQPHELLGPRGGLLYRALTALKHQGIVEKIGISIYGPDELDALVPHFQFDLIQAPFNIIDRRLASSGWLARLHQAGTEVHIRSVFLQGLLLMDAAHRPVTFNRWQSLWDQWHRWLADEQVTPLQGCLGFVLSHPAIDRVVIGVDSLRQLQEILANAEMTIAPPPSTLMTEDLDLINPSRWKAA